MIINKFQKKQFKNIIKFQIILKKFYLMLKGSALVDLFKI